jgi:hypothetical protein
MGFALHNARPSIHVQHLSQCRTRLTKKGLLIPIEFDFFGGGIVLPGSQGAPYP